MAITIIVTNAGRAALVNAANTGTNAVTITQLGITAAVFVPNAAQAALPGEIKRIASVSGLVVADDQIHLTASDVTPDAYTMRGFGLYLADGTLFAIYGQAGEILNKTSESMMLLAIDVGFADIDAEMIMFGDTDFVLPPATTEILGLVELATTAEGQAGSDATRVLTPLVGKQSVLGWLLSQDGSGSGLDADMLDGLHATAFSLVSHNHNIAGLVGYGTMASQNSDGVNITGGAIAGVTLKNVQGDVGIGVAVPTEKLDVRGPSGTSIQLLNTADPSRGGKITVTGADSAGVVNFSTTSSGYALTFGIDGAEKMRVNTNGRVGIGTSTPADMLDVAGSARVSGGLLIAGATAWHAGNDGSGSGLDADMLDGLHAAAFSLVGHNHNIAGLVGYGTMASQNSGGVNITGGAIAGVTLKNVQGEVGIGVAVPTEKLDVRGPSGTSIQLLNTGDATRGGRITVTGADSAGVVNLSTTSSVYALTFGIDGAEKMRVNTNGRVGIGTSTPADMLDVVGSARVSGGLLIAGATAWHAGNDGSGSGLDADLLDGRHASDFVLGSSFAALFAQNGYQPLPNGLIIQWGRFTALANQYTNASLPMSFPNSAFSAVVAGVAGGGADSQDNAPSITGLSVNTITVYSADNANTTMHYIAIGY